MAAAAVMEDLDVGVDNEECEGSGFDDVEMACTGINMLLNNGFEEAFALFSKYKDDSMLMHSGYSFVFFMQALMSFEEEKLGEAVKILQETEKRCTTSDGFVKSVKKKLSKKKRASEAALSVEEKVTNQVIMADCIMYQAVLVFTNQDIPSYIRGGWLLRKAWKIYERLHRDVALMKDNYSEQKLANFSSPVDGPEVQVPEDTNSNKDKMTDSSCVIDGNDNELTYDILSRLLGAVYFGYGTFQLCISMVPPKILKLIEFFGFEGDREVGLSCLSYTSRSKDMKAPLATLALLWYHTVLRPFFALDGANHFHAGTKEAESIINEKEKDFPNSSLFLFFKGRIHRLLKENDIALSLYKRALDEARGQREIELMCLYEISWCHLLKLQWFEAQDGFARLQKESKFSQAYYTYMVAVCMGCLGELDGAHGMFQKVRGLIRRKNNQIEAFVGKRADKFKKNRPTQEHCQLLTLEMIFLWHTLPTCTEVELSPLLQVCEKQQDDASLLPLKCLLEGAIYKELGQEEMAITCLKEAVARHQGKKEDQYIPAFTHFELASIYMKSQETMSDAKSNLVLIKDKYKDYDFENRLSVRVNNALKLVKTDSKASLSASGST